MKRFCAVASVCLAAACGGSESDPCTVTESGGVATITCPDGSTATVADGEDGANGANGANGTSGANGTNGTNGTNGQNGTDNHIVASHFCQGLLQGTSMFFTYHVALMASGDLFVNGSVKDSVIEVGGTAFYSKSQAGADVAAVIFEYESAAPANSGWWSIALNRTTMVTVIGYHDVDISGGVQFWTMAPSDCASYTYP